MLFWPYFLLGQRLTFFMATFWGTFLGLCVAGFGCGAVFLFFEN